MYDEERSFAKPLGFWKSDHVPRLPPMVTDDAVQHSAVSSLLMKRKGSAGLSLLPMSLSLGCPPSKYGSHGVRFN